MYYIIILLFFRESIVDTENSIYCGPIGRGKKKTADHTCNLNSRSTGEENSIESLQSVIFQNRHSFDIATYLLLATSHTSRFSLKAITNTFKLISCRLYIQ